MVSGEKLYAARYTLQAERAVGAERERNHGDRGTGRDTENIEQGTRNDEYRREEMFNAQLSILNVQ
ncbi:hypothetical protein SY85_14625 [Flavisolibacter tropicus]|uniref:Uncharacterized protein n=1 Tax=Flavisolibacter tropicus TaxID=1492898 RepID=A0A172TX24_9BACT|nr:hypothetical protein SY85_14625 [Flavisolibacter tropicus]